jgi:uncharacterized NAD(P)/FAD-binding protein YdhS
MRTHDQDESLSTRARRSSDRALREIAASRETIVVGAGAAGTLAAIHLLSRPETRRVILVERACRFGRGLAYSTTNPAHLLNVQAGRMSISSAAPEHFVSWLGNRLPSVDQGSYAPRVLYGDYLTDALTVAGTHGRLQTVTGEAVSLSTDGALVHVGLADGSTLVGSEAILALGNPATANPPFATPELLRSHRYIPEPWARGSLDRVTSGDIVLIGSGLTAIDVALTLSGRPVRLHAVSRHGLLPHAHQDPPSVPVQPAIDARPGLSRLICTLRAASAETGDWRAVIDGLRPRTQRLWQGLTAEEQQRFLRHGASYWNIHRHRMPPEIGDRIAALMQNGRLTLHAGTISGTAERATAVDVHVKPRRSRASQTIGASYVINCTGPRLRLFDDPPALVSDLIRQGLARSDHHGIGLETTDHGSLIQADGTPSQQLYTLGTPRRGTLFESTAIPELRAQAEQLATAIRATRSHREPPAIPYLSTAFGNQ